MKEERSIFRVQVNYNQTLEEMVEAGNYDYANGSISSENFPVKSNPGKIEIHLIHFDRFVDSEEAIRKLDKIGLRPAGLMELLALGAQYPDVQREFSIIALGSVWRNSSGNHLVPYLWGCAGGRGLNLVWFGMVWGKYYRFAAVPK